MAKKFFKTSMAVLTAASIFACTSISFAASVYAADSDISAQSEVESGTLSDAISWILQDGTLTISGNGDITGLGGGLFFFRYDINKVVIADGVTGYICDSMFEWCLDLQEVTFPSGILGIEKAAFGNCASLKSINFPEGLQSIGGSAFRSCSQLNAISLPSTLKEIGGEAFDDCALLSNITYAGTKESLCEIDGIVDVFYGRTIQCADGEYTIDIESEGAINEDIRYSINDGVLTFSGTGSIPQLNLSEVARNSVVKIVISEGITGLNDYVFSSFYNTTECSLPSTLSSIGNGAFYDGLTKFTYNGTTESLQKISGADKALYKKQVSCTDGVCSFDTLRGNINDSISFEFSDGTLTLSGTGELPEYSTIVGALSYSLRNETKELVISEGITGIQGWTFSLNNGWYDISKVSLPSTLESIGQCAFAYCRSLEEIYIPSGVKEIKSGAFTECSSLKKVYLPSSVSFMEAGVFAFCSDDLQVMYAGTREEAENKSFAEYPGFGENIARMYFSRANAKEVTFEKGSATVNADARAYVAKERINMENPTWKIGLKKGEQTYTKEQETGMKSIIGDVVYGVVLYDFDGAELTGITLE